MPGRIRQHGQINTQQLQPLVITLRGGCFKQNARVGADGEPGIGGQFMLKLPRRPARIAERHQHGLRPFAAGDRFEDVF